MDNPFVDYNESKGNDSAVIPSFPRKTHFSIAISEEAYEQIKNLVTRFTTEKIGAKGISELLEQIGMYALFVERPENTIDPDSNVTTEQCRQSGFEDGFQGNPQYFLTFFGKDLTDKHQAAYMRGYYEGNFIRTRGK